MPKKIDVDLIQSDSNQTIAVIKTNDPKLLGHDAKFSLVLEVIVYDDNGINDEKVLYETPIKLTEQELRITIPIDSGAAFTYRGKRIALLLHTRVEVDDGLIFDTKVTERQELNVFKKPSINPRTKELVDPSDLFCIFKNFEALPSRNKLLITLLTIASLILSAAAIILSIFGFISPEDFGALLGFSGLSFDLLLNLAAFSFMLGCGIGFGAWLMIKKQFKAYAKFTLCEPPLRISRGDKYRVSQLVTGISPITLENIMIRVVACNVEKGQTSERAGKGSYSRPFKEPVYGVLLYEKSIARLPARMPIERFLEDDVSFDPIFESLLPACMASSTHGLDLEWEIQLIHPNFIDHKVKGGANLFEYKDFLEA